MRTLAMNPHKAGCRFLRREYNKSGRLPPLHYQRWKHSWIVSPVDVNWNIISDGRPSVAGHGPESMSLPSSTAHLLLKKKAAAHNMRLPE